MTPIVTDAERRRLGRVFKVKVPPPSLLPPLRPRVCLHKRICLARPEWTYAQGELGGLEISTARLGCEFRDRAKTYLRKTGAHPGYDRRLGT